MADNVKTLQTRIALKHDTWDAWHDESKDGQGAKLVLLKGEIGFCEIPSGNAEATTAPTVLFKVGDGVTPFKSLKWASALAADVYEWAKASDVVLEGKSIKFVKGSGENRVVVKEIAIPYMTESDVTAITNPLVERVAAVEAKFTGDNSVDAKIATAKQEAIDAAAADATTKAGNAETAAKAYTDAREVEIKKYADQAEADALAEAKKYADAEVLKDRNRLTALEEADAAQDLLIAGNTTAIGTEKSEREAADALINAKFGAEYDKDNTVASAIADAKKAGTDAAKAVTDLEAGQVTTNKNAIAKNVEDIAKNAQAIADEKSAREQADNLLDGRLEKVEAFFDGAADEDGNYTGLTDALDTLVEIQRFIDGEGEDVKGLLDSVNENAAAIEVLEGIIGDAEGGLAKDMEAAEEAISGLQSDVTDLQDVVDGYTTKGAIKDAIEAAQGQADKGVEDAGKAQAAADKAQGEVDALEGVVATLRGEFDVTEALALKNKEDIAAVAGRMTTAEGEIDALQADSHTHGNKAELDLIVSGDKAKWDDAYAKRHEHANKAELDLIATGDKAKWDGAATKATKNAEDIATIQADYLKMADLFIIDCGSSTKVIHEKPQA